VTPATPLHWTLLCVTGLGGAVGHFLLILAYARAPASVLSPFIGAVASKVVMARHTQQAGTANSSLIIAAILGIVGFFVVPLIGLPLGFVLGLWLTEYVRLRDVRRAWASAKVGLQATGWGMLIELASGLIAASAWLAAATLT
jgi:uncharacterized protein YqgC (DUF456 family)